MADDLVNRLLAQTGVYVGTDRDAAGSERAPQVARIVVTPLPGRSGVMFDYEGLSQSGERPRPHLEHALLARTPSGLALYSAHNHAPTLTELRETEPGYFETGDGAGPYPIAIRVEVPSPGRLIYSWSYGEPGGEVAVRNIGDVTLVE